MSVRLSDNEWEVAVEVCTGKQLEVLRYWRAGFGYKRIAVVMGLPRDSVRGRVDRALARLGRALDERIAA